MNGLVEFASDEGPQVTLDGPVDLADGIGAPHGPGHEEERCVDGPDGKAVLPRELAEHWCPLGGRVPRDHDLDPDEPRLRDVADRVADHIDGVKGVADLSQRSQMPQ